MPGRPNVGFFSRRPVLDRHGHRRRIAAHLAAHGPQWSDAAAAAVGLTLEEWWPAVSVCDWFALVGRGWVLTDKGRREGLG